MIIRMIAVIRPKITMDAVKRAHWYLVYLVLQRARRWRAQTPAVSKKQTVFHIIDCRMGTANRLAYKKC